MQTGAIAREFPLLSLGSATATTGFRSVLHDTVVAGTSDGRVLVEQLTFQPRFEGEKLADLATEVVEKAVIPVDPEAQRPVRLVAYREGGAGPTIAASVVPSEIVVARSGDGGETRSTLRARDGETFTHLPSGPETCSSRQAIVATSITGTYRPPNRGCSRCARSRSGP